MLTFTVIVSQLFGALWSAITHYMGPFSDEENSPVNSPLNHQKVHATMKSIYPGDIDAMLSGDKEADPELIQAIQRQNMGLTMYPSKGQQLQARSWNKQDFADDSILLDQDDIGTSVDMIITPAMKAHYAIASSGDASADYITSEDVMATEFPLDSMVSPSSAGSSTLSEIRHILRNGLLTRPSPTTTKRHVITEEMRADCQFPFLVHDVTVDYVRQSKVMFVMRGLPGSGKTTVARLIRETYPEAIYCSADDYFLQSNGIYRFKKSGLPMAHQECQMKAAMACQEDCATVIIDNTHVKMWEMDAYRRLAAENNYTVVVVEPRTSWCRHPAKLARRNKHGVSIDIIRQKFAQWDAGIPLYYGWFLNETQTNLIANEAEKYFRLCVNAFSEYRELVNQIRLITNTRGPLTLDSVYSREGSSTQTLHCTAFFANHGRTRKAHAYHAQEHVAASLGSCCPIDVIGFVFTPRTAGVRLRLSDHCLTLWGKDDYEGCGPHHRSARLTDNDKATDTSPQRTTPHKAAWLQEQEQALAQTVSEDGSRVHLTLDCASGSRTVQTGFDMLSVTMHEQTERCSGGPHHRSVRLTNNDRAADTSPQRAAPRNATLLQEQEQALAQAPSPAPARFQPVSGDGSRAHLTLGCASGSRTVQTGFDMLSVTMHEQTASQSSRRKSARHPAEPVQVGGAAVWEYDKEFWVVYLDDYFTIDTLFSGRY